MIRRPYFSFSFILFTGLAALAIWLDRVMQPLTTTADTDFYQQPDYIVENLYGLRVDHEHAIHRFFRANKMFHYLNQDLTQLEQIHFINTQTDTPPFRVRADHAEIQGNGENIYLTGNVTVVRGADEDKEKITLKTNMLHLIPDEDLARTDKNVMMSRRNTTIRATGLELDNRTGMLEFLSRVHAVDQ